MLKALIDFLLNRKGHPVQKDTTLEVQAPYKVEPPTPVVEVKADSNWPFPTAPIPEEKPAKKVKPDRKSTRLNSSHIPLSRMPSSA